MYGRDAIYSVLCTSARPPRLTRAKATTTISWSNPSTLPWECGRIRPGDSCCSFCPCESWWSCGCTQDTIYRISSIHYNYNIDYYSSLFCVYRQPVLKIKNFCRGIRENQPNTAEVGLATV